jgi:hypothetical protein
VRSLMRLAPGALLGRPVPSIAVQRSANVSQFVGRDKIAPEKQRLRMQDGFLKKV